MYDYNNGYDEVLDDDYATCKEQSSCENCPNYDECYSLSGDEVQNDYETMGPDEFLEKYL